MIVFEVLLIYAPVHDLLYLKTAFVRPSIAVLAINRNPTAEFFQK
jgi:hypothetical protein